MVPVGTGRELDALQRRLRELEAASRYAPGDEDAKFDFADRTGDFLIKLSLLLDKVMNRVWETYNERDPAKNKANVYFPLWESTDRIPDALARLQLARLPDRNPRLFEALVAAQPFQAASPWLAKLKTLAGLRHNRHPNIVEEHGRGVSPDPSAGFQIGTFVVQGDSVVEDDEGWACLLGQPGLTPDMRAGVEAGRMRIEVFTRHLLEETNAHPVDFCADCLANARSLVRAIFRHMP